MTSHKLAIHERDRYTCICCYETFDNISKLDADHIVPEGKAGSDTIRNKTSLCRRCHEAKHGQRNHAPTVRCISTGDMIEKDFRWFRYFWKDLLPTLSTLALDHRIEPVFNIADDRTYQAWHIPIGELRRLDEVLADMDDVQYRGVKAHRYM